MNYQEFFSENNLIFMTHIGFLSSFYPYDEILPKILRSNFVGGNQNSHFLSVEGFASFGVLYGPWISFTFASILLSFMNYQFKGLRLCQFSLCAILPLSLAFCDQPLSTSMLSGGLVAFSIIAPVVPYSFGSIPDQSGN